MSKIEEQKPTPEKYFEEKGNDKVYVYCRVSTPTQDINKQFDACYRYCREHVIIPPLKNVYYDKGISGGKDWREREIKHLQYLKKGDILIIPEISRIGRDFINLCSFLDIVLPRGCVIHEIKGDYILSSEMEMNERMKMMMSCIFSEFERDSIKKRTKSAMQSDVVKAKLTNKLDDYKDYIIEQKKDGKNANQITELLKIKGLDINKSQVYVMFKKIA